MIIALPSLHSFHPSTPANPLPGSPFLVKMDGGVMSEELTRQKGVANQVDVGSHCEISLTIPGSQRVVFLVLVVVLFVLFVFFVVFFVVVFCCCFCFCCFNQIDYEFQLRCVFQWSFDSSTSHHNGYPHNNHNHTTTTTPPQPQQPHHNNHTTTAIKQQDLESSVISPSGKVEKCAVESVGRDQFNIAFVPKEVGVHTVSVKHQNIHIPGA